MNTSQVTDNLSDIEWWRAITSWLRVGGMLYVKSLDSPDNETKVVTEILRVLDRLPPQTLATFLGRNPFFVCLDIAQGAALRFPPDGEIAGPVTVIYLHPATFRSRADRIADLVAHEVAHVVLRAGDPPSGEDTHKITDDLVESWGFRRSYSPRQLQQLQRYIELVEQRRQEAFHQK
jgi:hypothetical protein